MQRTGYSVEGGDHIHSYEHFSVEPKLTLPENKLRMLYRPNAPMGHAH